MKIFGVPPLSLENYFSIETDILSGGSLLNCIIACKNYVIFENNGFLQFFYFFFENLSFYEIISFGMFVCIFCFLFLAIFFSFRLIFAHSTIWALGYFSAFLVTLFFSLFLLGLDYVSLVFLIVYVGGVAVLFLFGVFLMDGYELVVRPFKKGMSPGFLKIIFLFFIFICIYVYIFYLFPLENILNILHFYEIYFLSITSDSNIPLLDLNTGFLLQNYSYYNLISARSIDFFIIAFFLYEYFWFVVLLWGFVLLWILFMLNDFIYFFPTGMRELFVGYQIYVANVSFSFKDIDKNLYAKSVERFIFFFKNLIAVFLIFLVNFFLVGLSLMCNSEIPIIFTSFLMLVLLYLFIWGNSIFYQNKNLWGYLYFALAAVYINKFFFSFYFKNGFLTWYISLKIKKKTQNFFLIKFFQFYYFLTVLNYNLDLKCTRIFCLYRAGFLFFFENLTFILTDTSLIFAKEYILGFIEKKNILYWTGNILVFTLFSFLVKWSDFGITFFFVDIFEFLLDFCVGVLYFYCIVFGFYILRNLLYKNFIGFQPAEMFCWRITLKIFVQVLLYTIFVYLLVFLFIFISGVVYGYFIDANFFQREIFTLFLYCYYYFNACKQLYTPLLIIYFPLVILCILLIFFAFGYLYLKFLKNDYYINRISVVHLEFGYAKIYTVLQILVLFFQGCLFFCVLSFYSLFADIKRIVISGLIQNFSKESLPENLERIRAMCSSSDFYYIMRFAEKTTHGGKNFYLFGVSWNFDLLALLLIGLTIIIFTLCFFYNIAHQKMFEIDILFFQIFLYFLLEVVLIFFFLTDNLLIFYATFELSLLPTFVLIWFFGKRTRRIFASYSFILYTVTGSALFLLVLIFVYQRFSTFDISILTFLCRNESIFFQKICWVATFVAFAVKIPLVPFHSWLPETHVEAPTAVSVILAAILLKLGLYGLVRITIPFFPLGTVVFSNYVLVLSILGLLYATVICFYQIDIKKIVAYSSVAHMSGAVLSLFLGTKLSILSFYIMIFSHALISAALFFLIGCLYDRYSSRLVKDFGGLARILPNFSFLFFYFFFANIGLPGTPNFWSEFYLISSLYSLSFSGFFSLFFKIFLIVLFLTGVYSLVNLVKILFGELKNIKTFYKDLSFYELLPLLFLFFSSLFLGLFPDNFYGLLMPNVLETLYYLNC